MLGMIVGISENPQSEAIPIVQNQDGQTKPIHHSNLELYED